MARITRASTALRKAADLLVAEGWTKGSWKRGPKTCTSARRCAVGALAEVTGDLMWSASGWISRPKADRSDLFVDSLRLLALTVAPQNGDDDDEYVVTSANDHTTGKRVVAAMLKAAKTAERLEWQHRQERHRWGATA